MASFGQRSKANADDVAIMVQKLLGIAIVHFVAGFAFAGWSAAFKIWLDRTEGVCALITIGWFILASTFDEVWARLAQSIIEARDRFEEMRKGRK